MPRRLYPSIMNDEPNTTARPLLLRSGMAALLLASLAGCRTLAEQNDAAMLTKIRSVQVIESGSELASARLIGAVSGTSCYAPTVPDTRRALSRLRLAAAKAGANAVINVVCGGEEVAGCRNAAVCRGEAVRLP